ncbi:MAG: DEAD/DEAH box helicase family protein [Pseudohongiellaceae bacterium]
MTQSAVSLYDFQNELIARAVEAAKQGKKRFIIVLPTGAGKTVVAADIARRANAKGSRIMFAVHRQELIQQAQKTMTVAGLMTTSITAGKMTPIGSSRAQVATVQTLVRRIEKLKKANRAPQTPPDIVFWDEAHHCAASTWKKCSTALREWNPRLVEIGLTATPERTDGKGLADMFEAMVIGPDVATLIDNEFLAPFVVVGPLTKFSAIRARLKHRAGDFDTKQQGEEVQSAGTVICGETVSLYQKHLDGKQAVFFGVDVAHSKRTAQTFRAAGITAEHIDGTTRDFRRIAVIDGFRKGRIKVLCNCNIIGEGFDCPNAAGVIIARHSESITYFLQAAGRALRWQEGKVAKIIDQAGNFQHLGYPDDPRDWSLQGRGKVNKAEQHRRAIQNTRACRKCSVLFPRRFDKCPQCGHPAVEPTEIVSVMSEEIAVVHSSRTPDAKSRKPSVSRGILMSELWAAGGDKEKLRAIKEKYGYADGFEHVHAARWQDKHGGKNEV